MVSLGMSLLNAGFGTGILVGLANSVFGGSIFAAVACIILGVAAVIAISVGAVSLYRYKKGRSKRKFAVEAEAERSDDVEKDSDKESRWERIKEKAIMLSAAKEEKKPEVKVLPAAKTHEMADATAVASFDEEIVDTSLDEDIVLENETVDKDIVAEEDSVQSVEKGQDAKKIDDVVLDDAHALKRKGNTTLKDFMGNSKEEKFEMEM